MNACMCACECLCVNECVHVCMCMSVYVHIKECAYVCLCMCVHQPARGWWQVSSSMALHFMYLGRVSPLNPHSNWTKITIQLVLGSLSSPPEYWGSRWATTPSIYVGVRNTNGGPHIGMLSVLPTEPSPQTWPLTERLQCASCWLGSGNMALNKTNRVLHLEGSQTGAGVRHQANVITQSVAWL